MNPWRVSAIVVIVHVVVVVVVVIVDVVAVVVVVIIVVELSSSSHESNPKQTLNQAPIGVQQKAGIGFRGKIILMGENTEQFTDRRGKRIRWGIRKYFMATIARIQNETTISANSCAPIASR